MVDTSVWVAGLVEAHPRHDLASSQLRDGQLYLASHSVAELYAVLTSLPTRPRIGSGLARRLIHETVLPRSRVVELDEADYRAVLERVGDLGLTGGTVYDALVVQAALKAKASRLVTFNGRDFRRVWPDAGDRLQALA